MAPIATISIVKKIGKFFSWLRPSNIVVVALLAFIAVQVVIINRNRDNIAKQKTTISSLEIDKRELKSKLDDIASDTKTLQDGLDKVGAKNKELGVTVDKYRQQLKNKPLPEKCPDIIAETRDTNTKAIELWKK